MFIVFDIQYDIVKFYSRISVPFANTIDPILSLVSFFSKRYNMYCEKNTTGHILQLVVYDNKGRFN